MAILIEVGGDGDEVVSQWLDWCSDSDYVGGREND